MGKCNANNRVICDEYSGLGLLGNWVQTMQFALFLFTEIGVFVFNITYLVTITRTDTK